MDKAVIGEAIPTSDGGFKKKFKDIKEKGQRLITGSPSCSIVKQSHVIRLIDTAGVGDNKGLETNNMLGLYSLLVRTKEISCAALVVKFPTLITDHWKQNLHFYTELLPQVSNYMFLISVTHFAQMFSTNVILVVTGFPDDEKWIARQTRSGTNPRSTLEKLRKEVLYPPTPPPIT
jgi:hypothetical protein